MRVPVAWLAEWIDVPESAERLAEQLTMGGLEVEEVERTGPEFEGIRVGHVVEREPHPNADRLSLCRVDAGGGEPLPVVCGAPNVAAGQKIAFAPPGTRLPDGTKLKKSKIRGQVSMGMICSERELGLGDAHEGILVLDDDAPVGAPLDEVLSLGETVLEIAITANRGDCVSMLGIAREVRAHFGGELRLPETQPSEGDRPVGDDVRVSIEEPAGCRRYVGRVVRGIRVAPSPDWLVQRVESAGLRSINAVVDVTNLVMHEFGQPLHAFDLQKLEGEHVRVRVRAASADETIETLDGETRRLAEGDLVIADASRAIALAGVMGGISSEVSESTTDVLIESAHFDPSRVRRTARRLGLSTDASYRFERGIDPAGVERAAHRAARLVNELCGGAVSAGIASAEAEAQEHAAELRLEPSRVNQLLGTDLDKNAIATLLGRVGIASSDSEGVLVCTIPSHRNDISLPVDLIEEVARIHGFDRIPSAIALAPLEAGVPSESWRVADRARDALVAEGLVEVMSFPFMDARDLDAIGLEAEDPRRRTVRVLNPVVQANSELRPSLVPALLHLVRENCNRQVEQVRIFEVSRVFRANEGEPLPDETLRVAAIVTGSSETGLWEPREPLPLFFVAKGIAERLVSRLDREAEFRTGSREPYLHPGACCEITVAGEIVGVVGEVHPAVAARFKIEFPCATLDLDLSRIADLPTRQVKYRDVSLQPLVRRDIAVLLDRHQAAGEIIEAIRKSGGSDLDRVEVFDRYEGKGVPDGKVSLAFRLVYQRADRALRDAEVGKATDRIVKMLAHRFGGELR